MKAVVKHAQGPGQIEYIEVPEPSVEKDLVKIKVAYAGICGSDMHAYEGKDIGAKIPVILGHEFSGIVTEIGPDVERIKVGDRVTGSTMFFTCGKCPHCLSGNVNLCINKASIGRDVDGSMAQYLVHREKSVYVLPDNVSLLSGALTEPLGCSVHACMEVAPVKAGEIVCVFGAGALGLFVAQIAKSLGAYVVIAGFSSNRSKLELAGADRIVEQDTENIKAITAEITNGIGFDACFECSGAVPAANAALQLVKKTGKVVQLGIFANDTQSLVANLVVANELQFLGARSQKPSSTSTAIELQKTGRIVPDSIVVKVAALQDWHDAFEFAAKSQGGKTVLCCNDDLVDLRLPIHKQ